jgi:hypothetical protein
MGASAWVIYGAAKEKIGNGTIQLDADNFRLALYTSAATANVTGDLSIQSSIGNEVAQAGGYVTGGNPLSTPTWARSGNTLTFDAVNWQVSGSVANIRFAVVLFSVTATSGHILCYSALSNNQFDVSASDTLVLEFAATGIFILI